MSEKEAIPCIACGARLGRSDDQHADINQPYGGTAFYSDGHYGSTVFDPIVSGDRLHIVVCDDCLKRAAAEQKVYTNVAYVVLEESDYVIVGREWVHRPLVEWSPGMEYDDTRRKLEPEEVGDLYLSDKVEWTSEALKQQHGRPEDRQRKADRIAAMDAELEKNAAARADKKTVEETT
jgi:hypothetical protein